MKVFHTAKEVVSWRTNEIDRSKATIGFVATMGCLHDGHRSLIEKSLTENDYTIVSIFVNPSQFGPTEDLDKYPRTLQEDIKMLESLNVDALFAPSVDEMYPQGIPLQVEKQRGAFVTVLGVSEMLEGASRPGFFRGVATVVTKLLNITMPDVAYFGQKDIQQFVVLTTMVRDLFVNTTLKLVPIVRNESGLALSSRNKYFCDESLQLAANIYRGLRSASELIESGTHKILTRQTILDRIYSYWNPLIASNDFKVDYVSIARLSDLQEIDQIACPTLGDTVISCAVFVTDREDPNTVVRLINNVIV